MICPRTKVDLRWDEVKETAQVYAARPAAEKAQMPYLQLDDISEDPTPEEVSFNLIKP